MLDSDSSEFPFQIRRLTSTGSPKSIRRSFAINNNNSLSCIKSFEIVKKNPIVFKNQGKRALARSDQGGIVEEAPKQA